MLDDKTISKKEYEKRLAVSIQLDSSDEADAIIETRQRYDEIINNLIP
jgi:hypothetical protein